MTGNTRVGARSGIRLGGRVPAPQGKVEGGEALLAIEKQQPWIPARVRGAGKRARAKPHRLVPGIQCEQAAHGIAAQHGDQERADAVFVPLVGALEIGDLDIAAVNPGDEVC